MEIRVFASPDSTASEAARVLAAEAWSAVRERGRFIAALSGGHTPWLMLRALAREDVPWDRLYILQVDERVAPAGDADRNLTHLRESLIDRVPLDPVQIQAMPVDARDLNQGAEEYASTLRSLAGSPPVLDLIHLGLGPDGHTASLVPGDPVLEITGEDVGITRAYQGRQRMTLTYPILNRARRILWLVTGGSKAGMLARLAGSDESIPAGRVRQENALILADRAAAGQIGKDIGPEANR